MLDLYEKLLLADTSVMDEDAKAARARTIANMESMLFSKGNRVWHLSLLNLQKLQLLFLLNVKNTVIFKVDFTMYRPRKSMKAKKEG
jgi:hypothetical protein